jgi:hypothetical protein
MNPKRESSMSEPTAEAQVPATGAGEQEPPTPKPTETVEFWKHKAREQEARAKANASAAERLAVFEDRDKSEAQRLTERAEAAEKRAMDLESRALRLEIASEKGLTTAQAKRLVGSTREELESDADDLIATFPKPVDDPLVPPSLDLGPRGPASTPLNGDPLERALRNAIGIA